MAFDFLDFLQRQAEFSERTFGPYQLSSGVLAHIDKELAEIRQNPADPVEWVDVALLALDGARRAGHSLQAMVANWPLGGSGDFARALSDMARIHEVLLPPQGAPSEVLPRLEAAVSWAKRPGANVSSWLRIAVWAFEGARRTGLTPEDVLGVLEAKFACNQQRQWPDWRTLSADQPIEHGRTPG